MFNFKNEELKTVISQISGHREKFIQMKKNNLSE